MRSLEIKDINFTGMSEEKIARIFRNCISNIVDENEKYEINSKLRIDAIEEHWMQTKKFLPIGKDRERPYYGVLRALGYQVGTDAIETPKRKAILRYAFLRNIPPIKDQLHMKEWGQPKSKKRYDKIQRCLKRFISEHQRDNRYEKAVRDWGNDLGYFKEKYESYFQN